MSNQLISSSSPYLLQHQSNPVHWQEWGDSAFEEARRRNVPVFLSIGYSTCHWCHVMAHESFEDTEVADQLNPNFVCIKVDREERPDVDEVYMKAVQALTGGGGWPLSAWLTPDGKPFFAGTYFPKFRFLQLLRRISDVWQKQKEQVERDAEQLTDAVSKASTEKAMSESSDPSEVDLVSTYQHAYDDRFGGFGMAPKFPPAIGLRALLRRDYCSGLNQTTEIVNGTLVAMARGGVYDQLAGGFHRYSVDDQWLVPHFEKMLYDQAMLLEAYAEAFSREPIPEFRRISSEIAAYVLREMRDNEGRFFSAMDADSLNPNTNHMEEGYFATYAFNELKGILSEEELDFASRNLGVTSSGQFEGRNILHLTGPDPVEYSDSEKKLYASIRDQLLKLRRSKPQPHLDDKSLLSWNSWMCSALITAGRVFKQEDYIEAAKKCLKVWCRALSHKKLMRSNRQGRWNGALTAEDLVAFVDALIQVSQVDSNPEWSKQALLLQTKLDAEFWSEQENSYWLSDGRDRNLPIRIADAYDGVTPSANSQAAYNLIRLFFLTGNVEYRERCDRILNRFHVQAVKHPSSLPYLDFARGFRHSDKVRVNVFEPEGWSQTWVQIRQQEFRPFELYVSSDSDWKISEGKGPGSASGKGWVQVCTDTECLPVYLSEKEIPKN